MRGSKMTLMFAAVLAGACADDVSLADTGDETSGSSGTTSTTSVNPTGDADSSGPPIVCTPGERVCGSAEVLTCSVDGTNWESELCPEQQVCLDGACEATSIEITTEVVPPATLGFEYAAQLEAAGGTLPYAWSVASGELPPGITLGSNGALTGMPEVPGDYIFGAEVMGDAGDSTSRSFSVTAHPEPLTIITLPDLGNFDEGESMNAPLVAVGGGTPYGWFLVDGSLPDGLIVDAAGAVTGTPLEPGAFDFRVRVVDAQEPPGYDEQDFSLQVDLRPLTIVGEQEFDLLVFKVIVLPLLTIIPGVPVPYSAQLEADGGLTPYAWSEQPLPGGLQAIITQAGVPDGLTLDANGTLSGSVSSTDQVITVPILLSGIDLTGFFFYAEVADSQAPAETATALFLVPTLPVGG